MQTQSKRRYLECRDCVHLGTILLDSGVYCKARARTFQFDENAAHCSLFIEWETPCAEPTENNALVEEALDVPY